MAKKLDSSLDIKIVLSYHHYGHHGRGNNTTTITVTLSSQAYLKLK